jgi:hypothetical protein
MRPPRKSPAGAGNPPGVTDVVVGNAETGEKGKIATPIIA